MSINENPPSATNVLLTSALFILVALTCLLLIVDIATRKHSSDTSSYEATNTYESSACNISGITVRGYVDTYGENSESDDEDDYDTITSADTVLDAIESAKYDDDIKAVIVEIDSYGGNPVAAEEIAHSLQDIGKPIYAHIRGIAASGGYWIASSADTIYASKNSSIGSIGATMSYLDQAKYNEKEGLFYNQISSGKFKDSGSSDKSLSEEEKAIFQRDVDIIADNFIEVISKNRTLPIENVQKIADGSTMLGEQALTLGLIDKIGVMNEVYDDIEEELDELISICWN